jgi:hypothetical protein
MELIPDYETPEHYEKRTGKRCPDDIVVFHTSEELGENIEWETDFYFLARRMITSYIVIADPPVPPPDNWKPGE